MKRKYFRNITKEIYVDQTTNLFRSLTQNFSSFKVGAKAVLGKITYANFYFERRIQDSISFHKCYVAELKDSLLIVNTYCRDKLSLAEIEKIFETLIYAEQEIVA